MTRVDEDERAFLKVVLLLNELGFNMRCFHHLCSEARINMFAE